MGHEKDFPDCAGCVVGNRGVEMQIEATFSLNHCIFPKAPKALNPKPSTLNRVKFRA